MIKRKLLSIALLLGILSGCSLSVQTTPTSIKEKNLKVYFLDVGQGNAQLLVSPTGKTMLIDGGNNDQEQRMLDYMKKYGIAKIDIVIGSHFDADHIGGLDKIIDKEQIGQVYLPTGMSTTKTFESLLRAIKNKGLKIDTAKAGVIVNWDAGVKVEFVGPMREYADSNDNSAVVRVSYGKISLLFPGDAEAQSEKDMIAGNEDLVATLLAVGHHGSNRSTSAAFLDKVNPKYAIIQVGESNKYGHPADKTLQRLRAKGINIFRTDLNGSITVISNGDTMEITSER